MEALCFAAAKAMEVLNYTPVKNKPIRIMKAMRDPHARRSGVGNVFVKVSRGCRVAMHIAMKLSS